MRKYAVVFLSILLLLLGGLFYAVSTTGGKEDKAFIKKAQRV